MILKSHWRRTYLLHHVCRLERSKLLLAPQKKAIVIENTKVIISEAILRTDKKARGTM